MPELTGQKDIAGYLRALWRWKFLFLVCLLAVPAAAFALARGKPATYRSTVLVGLGQMTVNTGGLGTGASFSTSNPNAIAELVKTRPMAEIAARSMRPPVDPASIAGEVSAEADVSTNFLRISAEDRSPQRAADIANAYARAISVDRQRLALRELNDAMTAIEAQLARLPRRDTATRPGLEQQLSQLRAARSIQSGNAAILESATPSSTPQGTGLRRSLELAALIGLLLGFGAVVLAENADRKLRSPEELEAMEQVPLLATIAPSAFSSRLATGRQDDEAFYMLHVALKYYNTEHRVRSVVIASPGEKEGKTTVATRLALAAANAGLNVVLIDGDLRRGQVAGRLGIEPEPGLAAVLAGERSLADALVEYPLPATGSGTLAVLPAGLPPQNPAALLTAEHIQPVLRQLEFEYQFVIVDTPAALAVGDLLTLMPGVSGVVLVARMGRSSRRAVRRLGRMIADAHGTLLGVVATAVTRSSGYYDGYSRNYYGDVKANGANGNGRLEAEPETPADDATPSPAPRE